ncbi:sulfatase-like hydrolase/transferase, partial [candidate division KSB1 bacterium]|nr:sulfatase-like hydrolase/transferase [candidate division KSB1 bacterium]NIR68789.1 sulfatase-like hydrolase/transferase [candidate division KSB1 bacterium]NIS28121.1 sulfatase-like hydrolase/transferase [candidate division KSB1 bacterium]NIT75017.1 sulfatase-like hydrolase/transferase [candidate division KSB1 bacterium]NIU28801.1 sulfatase-like hydrolase/transferase [candidate division KSB1 bacterium]
MQTKPNIFLITVDSLRCDHLGCYGYRKPTSPNIDAFAQHSTLFTHAFSNGPNTPHAFPAIMAARESLKSMKLGLFDAPATLAETLCAHGYATIGFNAANPYVSRYFHYHRGFDEFHDYLDFEIRVDEGHGDSSFIAVPQLEIDKYVISEESIKAKATLEATINAEIFEFITRLRDEPFFMWVHYMDTHYPYLPQLQPQLELNMEPISKEENFALNVCVRENMGISSRERKTLIRLYDAAVRQLDTKIAELLHFLKRHDLFESALIILTADHGEEFVDHGDLQHKSKLFEELMHVPFILKRPFQKTGECQHFASLLQLAPTIVTEAGMGNPFDHRSVFDVSEPETDGIEASTVFASASYGKNGGAPVEQDLLNIDPLPKRYSCRDQRWKYMHDSASNEDLLFDLVADPMEVRNVAEEETDRAISLRDRLQNYAVTLEQARLKSR